MNEKKQQQKTQHTDKSLLHIFSDKMNMNWRGIAHPENMRPSKFYTHAHSEDRYERRSKKKTC